MQNKTFLSLFILVFTFSSVMITAQTENMKSATDIAFNAFKKKDYQILKPLLDPNVKMGELPRGMNDQLIPQVLKQLPEPKSYKIVSTSKQGENTIVKTVYTYSKEGDMNRSFVFNKNGKIIDFDIVGSDNVTYNKISK